MNGSLKKKTIRYIIVYTFMLTVLAWIGPLLGGSPSSPGLGFIIWGTAPLLIAVFIRIVTRDWSDVGIKPDIRKNLLWYIISILSFPVMMVLTVIIGTLIAVSSISGFSLWLYLRTVLPALGVFFVFAIFEEFGWRGYLAPKLASIGISSYSAAVIVGVLWASWHLPYIRELTWLYSSEDLLTFIPRLFLGAIAFSLFYNEIRIITGTFWPAVLMHSIGNSVGHPLAAEYLKIEPGKIYLGSVGFDGLLMIVLFSLLGITLNRWRMKKTNFLKSPL